MSWLRRTIAYLSDGRKNKVTTNSVRDFRLVWLDKFIDVANDPHCANTVAQLQEIVEDVRTFTDVNECIEFINGLKEDYILMVVSGSLGEMILPSIHDLNQIKFFCVFCQDQQRHRQWTSKWSKIGGVVTDIASLCRTIQKMIEHSDQDSTPISIINTTDGKIEKNLDQLDRSFMYSQILKEILLDIDFGPRCVHNFLTYCRKNLFDDDIKLLEDAKKIEETYHKHDPIWWYTSPSFLYTYINKALRDMDLDVIIRMGFFIQDLTDYLDILYSAQHFSRHDGKIFYRGQKLSEERFEQIKKSTGGLLSFNNFLSTSTEEKVAMRFAGPTVKEPGLVSILFVIRIGTSPCSVFYGNVREFSYYPKEEEVLFGMHSVFRIGEIEAVNASDDSFWKIHLTFTNDKDEQLCRLTDRIRRETFTTESGWYRLGNLLNTLGEYSKAELVCDAMFAQSTRQADLASVYHLLGMIRYGQGKYKESIKAYNTSIEIKKKIFSSTNPSLAATHSNIGEVYNALGRYNEAFSSHNNALKIKRSHLSEDHPDLAISYDNIGSVLYNMSVYSQAILHFEKALEIRLKDLPSTHPDIAQSYHNLGSAYFRLEENSEALSYFNKAIDIKQKSLPDKHISLATTYKSIGAVHERLQEYEIARSYYQNALDISQGASLTQHPSLRKLQKDFDRVNKNCH
ncbi:unnamed protein product [Adineta ricciae]|uniref:NAD(P)(+)--arginine ADP-ribosyltransferase n=1 Tax=Adineta ricciae TaxID=249248 RepID=A0A813PBL3_ADIRI|nr:unnamed protein product [Adineta ricciae]CAF1191313.1 unnamed protein product [Adineta ricciae]